MKQNGLVCKIDLEKAYDRVDWGFLRWTMEKKGFGSCWIQWVMGCLDHHHFSNMINGASKGFFPSSRGLRQGDPLSPFLFTLVADGFSVLMEKVVNNSLVKGFNESSNVPSVSYLQFVNDTICFLDTTME